MRAALDIKACVLSAKESFSVGEFQKAESLFKKILLADSENVEAHRGLARIATAESRDEEAIEHWLEVRRIRPDILETSLRLGRLYRQTRNPGKALREFKEYLGVKPNHAESQRSISNLTNLLRHQQAEGEAGSLQHVAIAGVSYCGSTMLSRILGCLDAVENIGESHWLVHKRDTGHGTDIDFKTDTDIVYCSSCGDKCELFSREFRMELQHDPVNWYFKIGERLNCEILVSADKNYSKLMSLDPLLRMDTIVLFKSPVQAWYSNFRKISDTSLGMFPETDLDVYLRKWTDSHTKFLQEFDNRGRKLFLNFESFCHSPEAHLRMLCHSLKIEYNENCLDLVLSDQHSFGGNSGVNKGLKATEHPFKIRKIPTVDLPKDHIQTIKNNSGVQSLYQRMMDLYRHDFKLLDLQ